LNSNAASISINLQRRMKIGYARAERLMDELEAAGIVGSSRGSKTRNVLLESESQLEAYL
jgi:S-DNA-T family DNA segregation ATPase FtsK/SpoIIIE